MFGGLQDLLRVRPIRRNSDRGDQALLPGLLIRDLCHRYVAPGTQTILQTFDPMAFVFEGLALVQGQLKRDDADAGHGALRDSRLVALSDERFDNVAGFDVAIVGDADAAFEAGFDFAGIILEAAQAFHLAGVDHDVVAKQADL